MNTELLDQLRDIHLPDAVSWWPPAPGWWIVALLISACLVISVVKLQARQLNNTYRREASIELDRLQQSFDQHQQAQHYLQEMLVLLRRLVKTAYPDRNLESLTTRQLLEQLSADANSDKPDQLLKTDIEINLYSSNQTTSTELCLQLHRFLASWISQHRRLS